MAARKIKGIEKKYIRSSDTLAYGIPRVRMTEVMMLPPNKTGADDRRLNDIG
jgi:hypothetical protein